jgi:AraC-like DNA-binding protein
VIFTESFGIKILEAYRISYAKPAVGGERELGVGTVIGTSERASIGHTHDFYHYIYAIESDGAYIKIGTKEYQMHSGCIYMIKPRVLHEISADESYRIKLFELKFSLSAQSVEDTALSLPNAIHDADGAILKIFNEITDEFGSAFRDGMIYIKLLELIVKLARCDSEPHDDKPKIMPYEDKRERFMPVLDYITENFASEITVGDLASIMHMEKNYFIKQFKRHFNITPISYIQSVRISRSLNLIEYTELPMAEIAERVGFSGAASFTKAFRATYSKTPSEYRQEIRTDMVGKYTKK